MKSYSNFFLYLFFLYQHRRHLMPGKPFYQNKMTGWQYSLMEVLHGPSVTGCGDRGRKHYLLGSLNIVCASWGNQREIKMPVELNGEK